MRRGLSRVLATLLVGALAAGACGSDDEATEGTSPPPTEAADTTTIATAPTEEPAETTAETTADTEPQATAGDTEPPATEPPATSAEPTGPPIKLMAIFEAGGASATPEIAEGVQAAAAAINRDGGVAGRPIEVLECDAGNDPNQAAECGRQAVAEGVVAVVSALSTNAGEYLPILAENKIPAVGNVPAAAADFISEASFPIYGGLPSASAGLAAGLAAQGATAVSVARVDLAAAAAIPAFAGAALATQGLAVVNDVAVPAGAPDMAAYVASAMQGGTDGVVVGLFGQDATNFIIQLRQTDPEVHIAATATDFAAVIEAVGDAADGIVITEFFSLEGDAVDQFEADMQEAGYDEFSGFRRNAYASVKVVAEVAAGLADVTAAELWAALPAVEGLDIGLMPPLQFTTGGFGGIPRLFNVCTQYAALDGGESVVFSDGFVNPFTGEAC